MKIIISTESGSDLPVKLATQHDIQIIPMHILMDGCKYLDGQISVNEILHYHDRTNMTPSTSAPSIIEYVHFFNRIFEKYQDCTIVHICYSSKTSKSFHNASVASKQFKHIYLIDTLSANGGLSAIVLFAAEQLKQDPSIELTQLLEKVEAIVPKTKYAFVAGNVQFIKAGGRVQNSAMMENSYLKSWPCIEQIEGNLLTTKMYYGILESVVEKLIHNFFEEFTLCHHQLYLVYSLGLSESIKHYVNEYVKEKGFENVVWLEAGAVISSHAGPGSFGIAGIEQ